MNRFIVGIFTIGLLSSFSSLNRATAALPIFGGKSVKTSTPQVPVPRTEKTPRTPEAPLKDEFKFSAGVTPYVSREVLAYGVSYERWTGYWWQWAYSAPPAQNPILDKTGKYCAVAQHGPVWFLAGSFESTPIRRTCNLPQDRAILVPIINRAGDNGGSITGDSKDMRTAIKPSMDEATNLVLELDGRPIPDIKRNFRFKSPIFSNSLPPNNLYDFFGFPNLGGVVHPSVADGYYVMLKPLRPGTHTLVIKGEIPSFSFSQNITYKLNVCRLQDVVPTIPDPRSCP
jgi:hypothetical protein